MTIDRNIIRVASRPLKRPMVRSGAAEGGSDTLESLVSSAVAEWDATQQSSDETILNRVTAPADGSNQTDYDANNGSAAGGSGSDEMTFTGSGSSAYYDIVNTFSGALLVLGSTPNAAGDQPQFILDMHKATNGNKWCAMQAMRTPTAWVNGNQGIMGSQNSNSAQRGWNLKYKHNTTDRIKGGLVFNIMDGSSVIDFFFQGTTLPEDKNVFIVLNVSVSGGNMTATVRINDAIETSVTKAVTDTTDGTGAFSLVNDDSLTYVTVGQRFYWGALFNDNVSAADMSTVAAYVDTRRALSGVDALVDDPDISALTGLRMMYQNYEDETANWVGVQEIAIWDGASTGTMDDNAFYGLTDVTDDRAPTFDDIVAGEFITNSTYSTDAGRLADGWSNTSVDWANNVQGGFEILVKFTSAIDFTEHNHRQQSPATYGTNPQYYRFLTPDDEFIPTVTAPSSNTDTDGDLPSPNTNAFTWTF